jgi:acetyl-CoA synthetase
MTEIIEAGNIASRRTFFSEEKFQQSYEDSIADPNDFWATQAMEFLTWQQTWSQVSRCNMARGEIEWFLDGKLNASENCIDRHLADKANRTAIIWEGDEPGDSKRISYRDLFEEVCKLANGLKSLGVKKGDRVCIYMPMIPEAAFAMLSCARIGAIHSVVFGGFSPQALEDRILDADCNFVITANEGLRGGKIIPLKQNVDKALENCPDVKSVIVAKRTENDVNWVDGRDFWYQEITEAQMPSCPPEVMDSEDPLFIL